MWRRLRNEKKNETTLFDRNPQQLSEGFSSENKMQRRFEKGGRRKEKKKHILFFGTWLGYGWDTEQRRWQNWGDWRLGKITFPGKSSKIPEATGLKWTFNKHNAKYFNKSDLKMFVGKRSLIVHYTVVMWLFPAKLIFNQPLTISDESLHEHGKRKMVISGTF